MEGVKIDLFTARRENWGLIYAIRTGSARFSHECLAVGWRKAGFHGDGGTLFTRGGASVAVFEETDLFRMIGMPYVVPEERRW